jgi:hypothetical protein
VKDDPKVNVVPVCYAHQRPSLPARRYMPAVQPDDEDPPGRRVQTGCAYQHRGRL